MNAVLTNKITREKKSLRDDSMMAKLVILDPSLLAHCPQQTIAHSGMDAFTQALEAFTNRHATWLSDALGLKALGQDLLDFIQDLLCKLDMPSPFNGKPVADKDIIVRQTLTARSTKTNPIPVDNGDVEWLLARLF